MYNGAATLGGSPFCMLGGLYITAVSSASGDDCITGEFSALSLLRLCFDSALTLLFSSSRFRVVFESFSRLTAVGLGGDSVYIWGWRSRTW